MDDALLIYLDEHSEIEGWLHLRNGQVVARGVGLEGLPPAAEPEGGEAIRQVAVVPGETVAVHWLEVPASLAPAQAAAAARLMAADVSTQPLADMHVAVGAEADGRAERAVALVPALTMAGWLGRLQASGVDPDMVLPEPLLLPEPEEGFLRYDRRDKPVYRSRADAFAIEPELAQVIVGEAPVTALSPDDYEAGLPAALEAPAVNLRQGAFAKRRRWRIDWATVKRLIMLGVAILLVTLAIQIVSILRYTYAADALEAEARRLAATAVPGADTAADPRARLIQRLADVRGAGAGYGAVASALYTAVNATPNVEVTQLSYERDGSLKATVAADSPATLAALQERIAATGFTAQMGPPRMGGGRQLADVTVQAQ